MRIPNDVCTTSIFTRRFADEVARHQETQINIFGIMHSIGLTSESIPIQKQTKLTSEYKVGRKINLLLTSFINYADNALRVFAILGLCLSTVFFLVCVYFLGSWFFFDDRLTGWSSLVVSIWFFGVVNLTAISIIALFLSVIFIEIKKRPQAIVDKHFP